MQRHQAKATSTVLEVVDKLFHIGGGERQRKIKNTCITHKYIWLNGHFNLYNNANTFCSSFETEYQPDDVVLMTSSP